MLSRGAATGAVRRSVVDDVTVPVVCVMYLRRGALRDVTALFGQMKGKVGA
ncbi:hypothetical protein GCM10010413_13090 [Promicromonospora sukumoe]